MKFIENIDDYKIQKEIKKQEYKNKLKLKLTNLIDKIYKTKDKPILDKSQLKVIKKLLKIITNRKDKTIIDRLQILDIINIINKKKIKKSLQELYQPFLDVGKNKLKIDIDIFKKKKKNQDIKNLEKDKIIIDIKNYNYIKLLLLYHNKIIKIQHLKDYDRVNTVLAKNEIKLMRLKIYQYYKIFLQKLVNFWFPNFILKTVENKTLEEWSLYICLKVPYSIEQIKNSYFQLYKKEDIYKIIIKGPWKFLRYIQRYSSHLIMYSKRSLYYYYIVALQIKESKYTTIDINILTEPYKTTKLAKNLLSIFIDIKTRLYEGYYDKYILTSIVQFEEVIIDNQNISLDILDVLKFDKLKIKLVVLMDDKYFDYVWIEICKGVV